MSGLQKRVNEYAKTLNATICPVCGEHHLSAQVSSSWSGDAMSEHLHYTIYILCPCSLSLHYSYCEEDDAKTRFFPAVENIPSDAVLQLIQHEFLGNKSGFADEQNNSPELDERGYSLGAYVRRKAQKWLSAEVLQSGITSWFASTPYLQQQLFRYLQLQ